MSVLTAVCPMRSVVQSLRYLLIILAERSVGCRKTLENVVRISKNPYGSYFRWLLNIENRMMRSLVQGMRLGIDSSGVVKDVSSVDRLNIFDLVRVDGREQLESSVRIHIHTLWEGHGFI
mmetsp:Transcript_15833/g.31787  ORF Transcript_15833/g.31787 Transcript_15833/m.31787 type:complete len:120 (-) Transcript_15833:897-1256(-)